MSASPTVTLELDGAKPAAARGVQKIAAPVDRVWQVIEDVERYAGRVPMIERVKLAGDRVTVELKFRIAIFSAKFHFHGTVERDEKKRVTIRAVDGEPRDLVLVFELQPDGDGSQLAIDVRFDMTSLGWLVKYFLKHHPEIEFGVFPGTALVILDAIKRASEAASSR